MATTRPKNIAFAKADLNIKIKAGSVVKYNLNDFDMAVWITAEPALVTHIKTSEGKIELNETITIHIKTRQHAFEKLFRKFS